jgi:hypothetical protein
VGKKGFEIGTKIAYRNGGFIGSPRVGNMDCAMVTEEAAAEKLALCDFGIDPKTWE